MLSCVGQDRTGHGRRLGRRLPVTLNHNFLLNISIYEQAMSYIYSHTVEIRYPCGFWYQGSDCRQH